MNKKALAAELEKWFKSNNSKYKNFWTTDPVASVIKKNLMKTNNFKKQSKGFVNF